ncbi:hypothetical protein [Sandaracinus amylolyticus]|uniref:hypothetical protein n=1 Tax=Sandaracinus amylolyticus TaxID=927083 RepID=UPI00069E5F4F|nr:hypothetical protein [Sandaracinus amylolyticus]
MTAERVTTALRSRAFLAANEHELHEGIESALRYDGVEFEREVRLDARSRVDFLTDDGVAIEVKVDGAVGEVARQLERYARSPRVTSVVLVTTRARHLTLRSFATMADKPLAVVWLGGVA